MVTNTDVSEISSERKIELDRFLSSLSSLELLYVRQKTQYIKLVLAGLEHLPPELICNIIPYIDLSTFLSCRLVSKAWYVALSQSTVTTHICREVSPGLLQGNSSEDPHKLFLAALRTQKRQGNIGYFKEKYSRWDMNWDTPEFANALPRPLSMPHRESHLAVVHYQVHYADNSVAWQPRRDLVIVDNLRTRKRQRIALTGLKPRLPYQLAAVSSQLIVLFTIQHRQPANAIHIWHFQDRRFKTLYLPNAAQQCYTEGDRVGVVTVTGQIILWSWNGSAIQQNLEGIDDRPENAKVLGPGLIFDANDPESVYAVWHYTYLLPRKTLCLFLVAQLKNAHIVWQSKTSLRNPLADCDNNCNDPEKFMARTTFSLQKADNYGSYALGFCRLRSQEEMPPHSRVIHEGPWEVGDIGAVTFNVLTRTFSWSWFLFSKHEPFVQNQLMEDRWGSYFGVDNFHALEGVYLWDRHLLVMLTRRESIDTPPQVALEVLLPNKYYFPKPKDYEQRNLPTHLKITSGGRPGGKMVWDGDRVVVPTRHGLWVCEPSEPGGVCGTSEPLDVEEDGQSGFYGGGAFDQMEHRPDYIPVESYSQVQLNHVQYNP